MVFQPNTIGYLITTVETVLLTGKRNAPIWLAILTGLALLVVLAGGVMLFLLLTAKTGHRSDVLDDYLGVAALLAMFLFPIAAVIRAYLRLDNPITIPRSSIVAVQRHGPTIVLQATGQGQRRPTKYVFRTRCQDEARTIERNLIVRAHGRLRCYPITFLPLHPAAVNLSKPDAVPLLVDTPEDTTR
jgi:hypothetical protein